MARSDAPGGGHQLRRRSAAEGPTGRCTSVNPSGVVVYKGTKAPDAAWEFVEVATPAPRAAGDGDGAQGVHAREQGGPRATSTRRPSTAARPSPTALAYAKLKPSFKGYDEFTTTLQAELDRRSSMNNQMGAKAALDEITPQLRQPSAREAGSRRSDAEGPARSRRRRSGTVRAVARHRAGPSRRGPRSRRGTLGHPVPGAHAHRAGGAVGRADPGHVRDQPHEVGPAHAPAVRRASTTTSALGDDAVPRALRNTAFYTIVSVPLGMALALGLALALNQPLRGIALIRTAYFLPLVTSATAVALVWLWIYSPATGP